MKILSEGPLDIPSDGKFCCEFLKQQLSGKCRGPDGHVTGTVQCPDQVICYSGKLREYSIAPLGLPNYSIHFCPSCGHKFPESLRDKWFDTLEAMEIDPGDKDARIPDEYNSDAWWNKKCDCGSGKPETNNMARYTGGYMSVKACIECLCEMCDIPHKKTKDSKCNNQN